MRPQNLWGSPGDCRSPFGREHWNQWGWQERAQACIVQTAHLSLVASVTFFFEIQKDMASLHQSPSGVGITPCKRTSSGS